MPSTDEEPRVALRRWVASKADREPTPELDAARLFQDGVLNSLDFIELIVLIERLGQAPVDVDELTADDVATIDSIVAKFLDRARLP